MKLESLRIFVVVVDAGSLQAASERLGKTPSGVSMALKNLEQQIGGGLFQGDRKNQLTPLGQYVLTRARQTLANFDATVSDIRDQVQHQSKNLRIGAVPSVMVHLMPAWVAQFRQVWPDVHLELRDMDSLALQRALESDELDMVIRSHIEAIHGALVREPLGWVLSEHHPLADRSTLSWADCRDQDLLSNRLCQNTDCDWLQQMDQTAAMRIHNTASLLAMVRAQQGITVLPKMAVQGETGVRFIPCQEGDVRHIKIHHRRGSNPLIQSFLDLLQQSPVALSANPTLDPQCLNS